MKATWFGVDVARVLHLAAVFCLTCVLLKAIQLYHRRRELLRALSAFPQNREDVALRDAVSGWTWYS